VATGASDGKVLLWNSETGILRKAMPLEGDVFSVCFWDSKTLATANDDKIRLWDLETSQVLASRTVTAATDYVYGGVHRNPNATPWAFCMRGNSQLGLLAIGVSDASVRIWDSNLNEQIVFRGHGKDICALNVHESGMEVLSGSGDNMCGVWDLKAARARLILRGHKGCIHDCCYLPGRSIQHPFRNIIEDILHKLRAASYP